MYEAAEVFGLIPDLEHCEMHDMLKAKMLKGALPEARVFYTSQGKSSLSDPEQNHFSFNLCCFLFLVNFFQVSSFHMSVNGAFTKFNFHPSI